MNWSYVWGFFAALFALITAMSHGTKVLEFVTGRRKHGLRVDIRACEYARDPLVHDFYEEQLNRTQEKGGGRKPGESATGTYWADNGRRQDNEGGSLSAYMHVKVENTGTSLLKNVQLTIPRVKALRYKLGYPNEPILVATPLVVGDMMPRSHKVIHALASSTPSMEDVILTHESGVGKVFFYTVPERPSPSPGNYSWWLPASFFFVILSLLVLVIDALYRWFLVRP
jgi:hypothetical protein